MSRRVRMAAFAGLLGALFVPGRARAVDAFEIQVYDGAANPAGVAGLELHTNVVPRGLTVAEAPELPPHHQSHLTLEPALGITPFWEIGGYLLTALLPDQGFDFAGAKLRSKWVTPPGWSERLRLGCNVEVSWVRQTYEAARWGGELRPIAAWENAWWHFAVNPIVEMSFDGSAPAFAPAAMALFRIRELFELGVEYYADFGSLSSPAAPRDQQHYLFEAVNVTAFRDVEINVGLGEGLSSGSNDLVAKAIFGYSGFGRRR